MILEVWSLNINTELSDPSIKATYHVYNRMSILLKSLISVTRVTPAYKLSRRQTPESYSIYYRIYCGEPQYNLGELRHDWFLVSQSPQVVYRCSKWKKKSIATACKAFNARENQRKLERLYKSEAKSICRFSIVSSTSDCAVVIHAVLALDASTLTLFHSQVPNRLCTIATLLVSSLQLKSK